MTKTFIPIIDSLLNDDLYKFTMGAVIRQYFPQAEVQYSFINRGGTKFPEGFAEELRKHVNFVGTLHLTENESAFLRKLPYMKSDYVDWLEIFQMKSKSVSITQTDGNLAIDVSGLWYEEIYWEVKLMAIISELYFKMTGIQPDRDLMERRIDEKGQRLQDAGCLWADFGTRRRFSHAVQSKVVRRMINYKGFLGTSNLLFAYLYDIKPIGTFAHEAIMGMSGIFGANVANPTWMWYWEDYYKGQLSIFLTDTFTTNVFLRTFSKRDAETWEGLRQDSYDPNVWADKVLGHLESMNVPTTNKKLVFSDNLNVDKCLALQTRWKDRAIPVFGIGTNLTNDVLSQEQKDVGIKPLNMVIKLTKIRFDSESPWVPVVKLSDEEGKHTGLPETIQKVKMELGI